MMETCPIPLPQPESLSEIERIALAREGMLAASAAYQRAVIEGDEELAKIFFEQREICWASLDELLI